MVMSPTRSRSLFEAYNVSVTGQILVKFETKFFQPGIRFKNLQSKIHFGKSTNLSRN